MRRDVRGILGRTELSDADENPRQVPTYRHFVARYAGKGGCLSFQADAASASPEIFAYLQEQGLLDAVRLPCHHVLEKAIEP